MDDETRQRFLKRLENYYARVLVEARFIAFAFGGRSDEDGVAASRATDLISEVTYRILNGQRAWEQEVDFVVFMKLSMKSVASNEWKHACKHDSIDAEVENEEGKSSPKRQFASSADPIGAALDKEEAEARVYELLEAADGDDRLTKVIESYLEDDCERPRHVAVRLGIPEKDVYQAQRKLERRVTARRKKVKP